MKSRVRANKWRDDGTYLHERDYVLGDSTIHDERLFPRESYRNAAGRVAFKILWRSWYVSLKLLNVDFLFF